MRYWDASALVALCVEERESAAVRRLLDVGIVTWAMSTVEIASAIERRARDGSLVAEATGDARRNLQQLAASWTEIAAIGPVHERALRLVSTHPLRAADALQLGAALVAIADRPQGHQFVCADGRLRDAADREGFDVLPRTAR